MKRTAIYMRVSTDRQARDGQSLGFQRSLLLEYVKTHQELVLVGEYMDDGVSGTKFDQRDELQRMLHDVENGKIDLIIFTKLDRFFRSVRHLMNTLDTLDKYQVEWKAIQENHDNTSPTGKLALTIMGAFAEMEASMDSQRTKDALKHKKSKKEWLNNRPPFGYKIEDKHAVPDPETADIVRRLFADYCKHGNLRKLTRDYLDTGTPTSRCAMKLLLKNSAYIGEKYGVRDYLEPIIDRDTFDKVQRLLTMNVRANANNVYLFSGLIVCPECGTKFGSYIIKKYCRYRCCRHQERRCSCSVTVSELKLEAFLIGRYKEDLEKRYLKLKEVKETDNSQKIASLYRKIDRLKELYVNELIDIDTYKADLAQYKADIEALERPVTVNTEHIENLLKMNVYDIYWTLSKEQKKRLWRSVIKKIVPKDGTFFVEYV